MGHNKEKNLTSFLADAAKQVGEPKDFLPKPPGIKFPMLSKNLKSGTFDVVFRLT